MARSPLLKPRDETAPLSFSKYSFTQLLKIKKNLESEMKARQAKEVEELRAKVTEVAQTLGMSATELLRLPSSPARRTTRKTKHAKGKQPAMYRGPGGEEWSGRGPAPGWMKPHLAKGKTKGDFLIRKH
jgi:DNA-binding protein H-NS